MKIRPIRSNDRQALATLISRITNFTPAEKAVAMELVDESLPEKQNSDYNCLLGFDDAENCLGYLCYGPTPMTAHTFDLYWIAVDPAHQGQGVGRQLLAEMDHVLHARGGKVVRAETSSQETYGLTLQFYEKNGFILVGRIPRFYYDHDDLMLFYKNVMGT